MALKLIAAALALVLLFVLAYAAMAIYSRRTPQLGLEAGQLRPCPKRHNCVCSETETANIEPLRFTQANPFAWEQFTSVVAGSGGQLRQLTNDYLHATFESAYFRFVDDFEARIDREAGVIHIRSASRVGYDDRGTNRRRVETVRAQHKESAGGG